MKEKLLTSWVGKKELQQYLGIAKRTVENYMNEGRIRFHKLGGKVLFDLKEIDEDIKGNRI